MTDLSRGGGLLGYPAIVPSTPGVRYLHNQRLGKVVVRADVDVDARFLYYLLCTDQYRNEVLAGATGTTVKHSSPKRILAYQAAWPKVDTQRAIGSILGALDDKINLNRQMSRTLEATGHSLFKSWFVDFDPVVTKAADRPPVAMSTHVADLFPSTFEDSGLGPIPQGWQAVSLADAFEVNPRRPLQKGQVAPYLDMQAMPTNSALPERWSRRPTGSGMTFMNGDTLVARITPCLENGKTAFVLALVEGEIGWGSTKYIVLRSRPPYPLELCYFVARSDDFRSFAIASMTGSPGRQRVQNSALPAFQLVLPSGPVLRGFGDFARALFAAIWSNVAEYQTLVL